MIDGNQEESIQLTLNRLYSQDANDRVKAAGELGEIGTPEIAPKLLEVAYEDEASTVRQMAIQSYSEILEQDSIDDIIKAARDHFDDYVRLYAITVLGRLGGEKVVEPLVEFIQDDNHRIQAAALRAMIHAETKDNAKQVFELLQEMDATILVRNCIEALSLWKFAGAKEYITNSYFSNDAIKDLELKTISAFYLAVFDDQSGKNYLENEEIDNYIRIAVDDVHYRGSKGLLEAAKRI